MIYHELSIEGVCSRQTEIPLVALSGWYRGKNIVPASFMMQGFFYVAEVQLGGARCVRFAARYVKPLLCGDPQQLYTTLIIIMNILLQYLKGKCNV